MKVSDAVGGTSPFVSTIAPASWPDLRPLGIASHWLTIPPCSSPRRLLVLYAHPDDETFGSGGTIARYSAAGVAVHYICATRGESGTVEPRLRGEEPVGQLRTAELLCAGRVLGLQAVHFLGYRDSGMPGAAEGRHPAAFAAAPLGQVVGQLVAMMRAIRPQVVVTHGPYGGYGHPDHIRLYEAVREALAVVGDDQQYRELAPGCTAWQPERLYYYTFDARPLRLAIALLRLFRRDPSRFGENGDVDLLAAAARVTPVTCTIDVGPWLAVKDRAFWCHRTQLGGLARLQRLPLAFRRLFVGAEHYTRAIPCPAESEERERDLFGVAGGV